MTDVLKLENENYLIRKLEELNMGKKMCSGEGQLVSELAVWEWEKGKRKGWGVRKAEKECQSLRQKEKGKKKCGKREERQIPINTHDLEVVKRLSDKGHRRWRWLSMKLRDTWLLFKREERSNRDLGKWVMKSMQDSKLWHRVSWRRNAVWMQKGDVELFGKGIGWISMDLMWDMVKTGVLSWNQRTRPNRTAAWRTGSRKMIGDRGKGSYLMLLKMEKDNVAREEYRQGESKSSMWPPWNDAEGRNAWKRETSERERRETKGSGPWWGWGQWHMKKSWMTGIFYRDKESGRKEGCGCETWSWETSHR